MKVEKTLSYVSLATFLLATLGLSQNTNAMGRPTFSIDAQGPTITLPDGFGSPLIINGHDILSAPVAPPIGTPMPGPFATAPGIFIPGTPGFGISPTPFTKPLGATTPPFHLAELDALSYGRDRGDVWYFSVDEFAIGKPGVGGISVTTEVATASGPEASADVFKSRGTGINRGVFDGNGLGNGLPGYALLEPNPVTVRAGDQGDNLDALNMDTTHNDSGRVYYSLDGSFADPLDVLPGGAPNFGTAMANGVSGADIIVNTGGANMIYAGFASLGLTSQDDIDALVLEENGNNDFELGIDRIAFSLRRGSASIGTIDLILGLAIEEGDVLRPMPLAGGGVGLGIVASAESLGLATVRSGTAAVYTFSVPGGGTVTKRFGDDLDALDILIPEPASLALLALGGVALIRRK